MTDFTPEQLELVRTSLFKAVHADYVKFINSLRELPINQAAFQQAYGHFDTGILWTKEAVHYGDMVSHKATLATNDATPEVTPDEVVIDSSEQNPVDAVA